MDIAEVLKIADDLMFDSTSKYLDNLQRSIVQGVWEGKTYKDIADSTEKTEGHIRDSAATLWKDISEAVGESVRKSNFKSVIERNHFSHCNDVIRINTINFCSDRTVEKNVNSDRDKDRTKRDVDREIPKLLPFYGRDLELKQLEQWIVEDECRLINIFGMSGIGKTALLSQLSAQIEDEFECVIWQSLRSKRSLVEFIDRDLLPSLPIEIIVDSHHDLETRISLLIEQLSKHRCLIVLDDIHHIFSSGDLAGTYEDDYLDYKELFRRISESNHQSCLVLVGREQPRFALFARSIPTLALDGLSSDAQQQILQDRGIVNSDRWVDSIGYYGGNPRWLNAIATIIKDLFGGRIEDFCQDRRLLLTNDLKLMLQSQFDRLAEIEQQVICAIADRDRSISFPDLIAASQISPTDLLEVLQSLGRRRLVDKLETDTGVLFDLQPIVREFISLHD